MLLSPFFPPVVLVVRADLSRIEGGNRVIPKADAALRCCGKLRASSCWRRIHGVFEAAYCCHEHPERWPVLLSPFFPPVVLVVRADLSRIEGGN